MTIWFHEGLPRSGKSYEAMVKHALPAIQNGRHVVTNIKGVNCEKIAEVLNIPVEEVELLVTIIPWDKTTECYTYVKNDCLLLLDEVQDFWPATRDRLGKEITELITQHGQRGLDIILMGQSNKDCHALWRRRIDKLIYFVQKDAIGKPMEYAWQLYKQTSPDKFAKVNGGGGKYEKKYFGVYSSHVDGTTNKTAYADDRANILKTPLFRFGFPAAGVIGIFAIWYVWHFFTSPTAIIGTATASTMPKNPPVAASAIPAPSATQPVASAVPPAMPPAVPPPADYVESLMREYRPRLSAYLKGENKLVGKIEWYLSDSQHRREVLSFDSLREFGYFIEVKEYGVLISKAEKTYPVTAWPFDVLGQVPERVQQSGAITGLVEPRG